MLDGAHDFIINIKYKGWNVSYKIHIDILTPCWWSQSMCWFPIYEPTLCPVLSSSKHSVDFQESHWLRGSAKHKQSWNAPRPHQCCDYHNMSPYFDNCRASLQPNDAEYFHDCKALTGERRTCLFIQPQM
jgi:hypothetical protein